MKRMKDEAVSPVIAVILMVAITVVLAATVFVLVADIGEVNDPAPAMAFSRDESKDQLVLISSEPGLVWSDFTFTGCVAPTGNVTAGQVIQCQPGDVLVSYKPSNSVVYRTVFN